MKKTIAVLFAVMMMLLSAVPAFAAASPEPSTFKYKVEVIPTEGGDGDYKFTTGIDEKGEQHVYIEPLPYDGYTFDHWEISGGPFRTDSKYTDPNMNIIISGDIVCTPYYRKVSSTDGQAAAAQQVLLLQLRQRKMIQQLHQRQAQAMLYRMQF